ncbi:hypothetical protein O5O45_26330 [Hahella aquimaris]|uniref:hypothetical protein n=1 Tax=Hahella sp. HNIBRBA332 TaxID=3015983 RepID=UPI00273A8BF8|nr:hypothetical protein [Hahella sp. HNIBRBA332]WLQ13252.1 hypothetical protein O5O45_26330 [Hahella sp. HNIBRBA332]
MRFIDKEWTLCGVKRNEPDDVLECFVRKSVRLKELEMAAETMPEMLPQIRSCQGALNNLKLHVGEPNYYFFYHLADVELTKLDRILLVEGIE